VGAPSAGAFFEKAGPAVAAYGAGDRAGAMAGFLSVVCSLDWETCQKVIEKHVPGGVARAMKNADYVLRPFEDPLPPEAGNVDAITFFFAYHDTVYMGVDRAKMNRRLYDLLKPGGVLIVADHSARIGDGIGVTKSLHRIEESRSSRRRSGGVPARCDRRLPRHRRISAMRSCSPLTRWTSSC
jgi:SAM-dependent methyltransferase